MEKAPLDKSKNLLETVHILKKKRKNFGKVLKSQGYNK